MHFVSKIWVCVLSESFSSMQSGYLDTGTLTVIEKECTMKLIIIVHVKFRYDDGHLYVNDR